MTKIIVDWQGKRWSVRSPFASETALILVRTTMPGCAIVSIETLT